MGPRLIMFVMALFVLLTALPVPLWAEALPVVEVLRLKVPQESRAAWLEAERLSWEPWLLRQQGFLGRELLWDREHEEGVLLIRWAKREDWLGIPEAEINRVQKQFEEKARDSLATSGSSSSSASAGANPFPLVSSGELEPLINPLDPLPGSPTIP